ncbi:hypothetical protein ACKKBF_B16265 [Auxenochlorella protothecoides x Auxenochlorella symbiontica]
MTEYHTIYKGPEGETTQWDDIQRKLGNRPEKDPVWKPQAYTPEAEPTRGTERLDGEDAEGLEEAEDEFSDDRFLEQYRQRRIQELQASVSQPRFGSLEEIRRDDFVAQVTNAGEGVWVVCHLYSDSTRACGIMNQCLMELAPRYPATKFLRIVASNCIPGYPDANTPTLLLYRGGKCEQTLVGLERFGGQATSPDLIAISLNRFGAVCGDPDDAAVAAEQLAGVVAAAAARRGEGDGEGDSD